MLADQAMDFRNGLVRLVYSPRFVSTIVLSILFVIYIVAGTYEGIQVYTLIINL